VTAIPAAPSPHSPALPLAATVGALGVVVGQLPGAIRDGMASDAGRRLIIALVVAALIYAFSLILDPIGNALGTTAKSRITGSQSASGLSIQRAPSRLAIAAPISLRYSPG